uniref:PDZ domain-containing protein n=1 Tax=Oryza rufipogon TaxID=4529 RepID=A0A0E0R7Z0_ORYRU
MPLLLILIDHLSLRRNLKKRGRRERGSSKKPCLLRPFLDIRHIRRVARIRICATGNSSAGGSLIYSRKLSVGLPDKKTVLDAELIYFNDHYDIALLHIYLDFTLKLPSIGRGPEYGQEVFVLARDNEASLRARRGNIEWLEESDILGRDYYMFLSCDIPEGGNGGMVIDNDEGWRRVARPVLGIGVRTIALLDVQLQEDFSVFGIKGGFLVDEVYNPVAEELGIKRGNVIISINQQDDLTLPELEDYLLSLGWDYLKDPSINMKDVKGRKILILLYQLRVCDIKSRMEGDVILPIRFYDKSEWDEEYYGKMGTS